MIGALVFMVGIPGSGKSTLAHRWFQRTQVTNLDDIRSWVADDESDQTATGTAVQLQQLLVDARCERGLLTCVDNTNLIPVHRAALLESAYRRSMATYAIVLDTELDVALRRNRQRADAGGRAVPTAVIRVMQARKQELVPPGPLAGFTVTRRIGVANTQFGTVPREHQHAPWLL